MAIARTHPAWSRTALGCLLFLFGNYSVQTGWAGEEQAPSFPSQDSPVTRVPLQPNNGREGHQREPSFGPIAHRLQEVILSDDSRLHFPQTRLNLDQALHVPDWLH